MIVTAAAAATGSPAVDLLVDAMPTGTAKVSVYRLAGGTQAILRDANLAPTSGSSSRPYVDWEVPLGIPASYVAYAYSAAGASLGSAQSMPVTVDSDQVWLSDPLAPSLTAPVDLIAESALEITHETPGDIQQVLESGLGIAVMGTTQVASAVPLRISVGSVQERDEVLDILHSADPFLLRCPPAAAFDLPPLAYLAQTSFITARMADDKWHITMQAQAVAPQVSPIVLAPRTYADLRTEASSYADLMLQRGSYLEVLRGY